MAEQHKTNIYFLLDAARVLGDLDTAQKLQPDFLCLFQEKDGLDSVAPYLFSWMPGSAFAEWLFAKGWGNSWGLFVKTNVTPGELKNHFQKFIVVESGSGSQSYSRFYDPRVIKVLLPGYTAQKLIEFFGPVEKFIVEGNSQAEAMEFSQQNGVLKKKNVDVSYQIMNFPGVTGE